MYKFDSSKLVKKQLNGDFPLLKTAVIGGGTGLSTLLRGLKKYNLDITAIVTVADNGGSSGMLREDLNMLPPGDIRNCILALANTEPLMFELMNYRFGNQQGRLSGQCFGNLFIAAMTGVSGNFSDAIRNMSKVLAVKGKVLPVSLENINIEAVLSDGTRIYGESEIGDRENYKDADITDIVMTPDDARPLDESCQDILEADILVIGPGSLYTSIIPDLLFPEIRDAIAKSEAVKIYVGNIMTQPSETYNYSLERHIEEILKYFDASSKKDVIHYCIANNRPLDPDVMEKYLITDSNMVEYENNKINELGIEIIEHPLAAVNRNNAVRHNYHLLAEIILNLWAYNEEKKRR